MGSIPKTEKKKSIPWFDKPNKALYLGKTTETENKFWSAAASGEIAVMLLKEGKVALAALLGTVVERYDYALYGYMTAILSQRFFPNTDPTVSLINHFLVFAMGFIAKPLGSFIFGSIGDKKGRKYALRWSIVGIALPTFLIGVLPSYEEIGVAAVILLATCRFAQGIFISAEGDGVEIFIYETLSKRNACLANSLTWISGTGGLSLASFLAGAALLPNLPQGAWRAPFILAGILGGVTLWVRKYLKESYDYMMYKVNKPTSTVNVSSRYIDILKRNKLAIFLGMLLKGTEGGVYYFYFVFWNNYLSKMLHIFSASEACFKASFLTLLSTTLAPVCGYVADRLGVMRAVKLGGILCIFMTLTNLLVLNFYKSAPFTLMILTTITLVSFSLPINIITVRLFKLEERYRCMSMSHALGSMFISSTTPAIAAFMWKYFQNPGAPLFYCCLLLLVGWITTCFVQLTPEHLSSETTENTEAFVGSQTEAFIKT